MAAEKPIRPMKAPTQMPTDDEIKYPCYASYKIDGLRAVVLKEGVMSNSIKPHPNKHCQELFFKEYMMNFDGEMTEGEPNTPDTYKRSMSAISTIGGTPNLHFWVFDVCNHDMLKVKFKDRYQMLTEWFEYLQCEGILPDNVHLVEQRLVNNKEELDAFEKEALDAGYEGVMTRIPDGPYKFGRSTMKQAYLHKIKRYVDAEAVIVDFEEQFTNTNEATVNAMGLTERGHSNDGKIPAGTLGTLIARDIKTGAIIKTGTGKGMTHALRQEIWDNKSKYLGQVFTYKHFPHGDYDAPRHPIFKGWRMLSDIDDHNINFVLHHESDAALIHVGEAQECDGFVQSGAVIVDQDTFTEFCKHCNVETAYYEKKEPERTPMLHNEVLSGGPYDGETAEHTNGTMIFTVEKDGKEWTGSYTMDGVWVDA